MAGELEKYIDLFNETDKLARELHVKLSQLQSSVSQAIQNIQALFVPGGGVWPTQDELRTQAVEVRSKSGVVLAAFNALPHEYKRFAPDPQSIGRAR